MAGGEGHVALLLLLLLVVVQGLRHERVHGAVEGVVGVVHVGGGIGLLLLLGERVVGALRPCKRTPGAMLGAQGRGWRG
jgi:hypothetical protein